MRYYGTTKEIDNILPLKKLYSKPWTKETLELAIYHVTRLGGHQTQPVTLALMDILKAETKENTIMTTKACNMIIGFLIRCHRLARARQALRWMHDMNIPADIVTYNTFLTGAAKDSNWAAIEYCLSRLVNEGLTPDQYTWAILVNASKNENDRLSIINAFTRAGIEPGEVVTAILLHKSTDTDPDKIIRLLNDEKNGHLRGIAIVNIVIHRLGVSKDYKRAVNFFERTMEMGIHPDCYTLDKLVRAAIQVHYRSQAYKWIGTFKKKWSIEPTKTTFVNLFRFETSGRKASERARLPSALLLWKICMHSQKVSKRLRERVDILRKNFWRLPPYEKFYKATEEELMAWTKLTTRGRMVPNFNTNTGL